MAVVHIIIGIQHLDKESERNKEHDQAHSVHDGNAGQNRPAICSNKQFKCRHHQQRQPLQRLRNPTQGPPGLAGAPFSSRCI